MKCEDYRRLHSEFTSFPLSREVYESKEYEAWQDHGFDCEECELWSTEQQVITRGYDPSEFPCIHIAYYSTMECDEHKDPWECPDMIIVKTKEGYGIPIRDGGSSFININNYPWCGIKL